jgi:glutamate carboxypeptidase
VTVLVASGWVEARHDEQVTDLLSAASERASSILDDIATLVNAESPSRMIDGLARSAQIVADLLEQRVGGAARLVAGDAGPHVHWQGGPAASVLILGHHDTVFPAGTVAQRPFRVADGRATGPGVFDMKAGIVQAIHALALLDDPSAVEMLITADEEIGSETSRALIEQRAQHCGAVLVLEPSAPGGALKIARKGTGTFEVTIRGRAAHAGLEPEKGINALVEAAHQVVRIAEFGRPERGTTVTPTLASAGTADNVVPDLAVLRVDARATEPDERDRIERAMASLKPVLDASVITVTGGLARPPMPASSSAELFALAQQVALRHGLGELTGVAVGGGSDGNFTGALGIPTLDGLGAVGNGAHTDHEYVEVATLPQRTALVAGLLQELSRHR